MTHKFENLTIHHFVEFEKIIAFSKQRLIIHTYQHFNQIYVPPDKTLSNNLNKTKTYKYFYDTLKNVTIKISTQQAFEPLVTASRLSDTVVGFHNRINNQAKSRRIQTFRPRSISLGLISAFISKYVYLKYVT